MVPHLRGGGQKGGTTCLRGGMTREIRQIDIFFKSPQNANKIIKKAGDRVFGHNQNSNLEYLSTDFKKN